MKVIFLGTNGWYDTEVGNTVCTLIETDECFIILDAGNGFYKIDRYITSQKLIYLFLSHFHLDHIIGLHILKKFDFRQGIRIYGQKGTVDILNSVINKPYTIPFAELPLNVKIYELPDGLDRLPFSVKYKVLLHSSQCFGYRIGIDGKVITYCPDTGICENAVELAKEADLLIAECSYVPGQQNKEWPHLNPEDAAKTAREARARRLVLTHFDANRYQTLDARELAQEMARKIFPDTLAAVDDMQIQA